MNQGLMLHWKLKATGVDASGELLGMEDIEDRIADAIEAAGSEFDGHLIGGGEYVMYMYGEDASRLLEVVLSALTGIKLPNGTFAIKQFGPPGEESTRTERVVLASS